jgi:tetratricopeptide (TPR) repeat protein
MKLINEAYSTLKNPGARRDYDFTISQGKRGSYSPPPDYPAEEPPFRGYAHRPDNKWGDMGGGESGKLRNEALAAFNRKDFQKTINIINKLLVIEPNDPSAYNLLALAFMETGNFKNAFSHFSTAIRLAPSNPIYYFNRGICYLSYGQPKQSIYDLEKASNLDVDNPLYLIGLARAYKMTGKHLQAKTYSEHARSIDPNHPAVVQFMNEGDGRMRSRVEYYYPNRSGCGCCPCCGDCLCLGSCCDFCCVPGGCCIIGG